MTQAPKIRFQATQDTIDCLKYWNQHSEIVKREMMEKHDVVLFDMMMNAFFIIAN